MPGQCTIGLKLAHEDLKRGSVFLSFGEQHHELALFEPASDEQADGKKPGLHHAAWQVGIARVLDEGAMLSLSGEPTDQSWGWREFALKDPDGYVWSIYQDNSGGRWT